MTHVKLYKISVEQPDMNDYDKMFPKMPCNTQNKQALFNLITDPDNIHRAIIFVEETNKSPVFVFGNKIQKAINSGVVTPLTGHEKQFSGAITRVVMEANEYTKTGRKQRFSSGIFSSAELYKKKLCIEG